MSIRHAWLAIAAAVLSSTVAFAQSSSQPASQSGNTDEMQVTLIGCLQREADYRRAHDLGRGGAIGAGLGRGDEFVLVNASRVDAAGAATPNALDCSQAGSGEAYELTGPKEDALKSYAGRAIQITGMMKKAKTEPVGTSGTDAARPTGGFDPLKQDLRLFEVNVTSFADVPAAAAASATPSEPAAPESTIASSSAQSDVQTTDTTGTAGRLPRTASPLPLAGLLGFLSLGGAFGLRKLRRR